MSSESVGSCGNGQMNFDPPERLTFEQRIGISLLRAICGSEPKGTLLDIVWHDHDTGTYPDISLVWEHGSLDKEHWDYINLCESTLMKLDDVLDWDRLWEIVSLEVQKPSGPSGNSNNSLSPK